MCADRKVPWVRRVTRRAIGLGAKLVVSMRTGIQVDTSCVVSQAREFTV